MTEFRGNKHKKILPIWKHFWEPLQNCKHTVFVNFKFCLNNPKRLSNITHASEGMLELVFTFYIQNSDTDAYFNFLIIDQI